MPNKIPENKPEHMQKNIPGRISEDIPIIKYIDIMMGIIRNKIFLFFFQIFFYYSGFILLYLDIKFNLV
jgi:hypothetical protein